MSAPVPEKRERLAAWAQAVVERERAGLTGIGDTDVRIGPARVRIANLEAIAALLRAPAGVNEALKSLIPSISAELDLSAGLSRDYPHLYNMLNVWHEEACEAMRNAAEAPPRTDCPTVMPSLDVAPPNALPVVSQASVEAAPRRHPDEGPCVVCGHVFDAHAPGCVFDAPEPPAAAQGPSLAEAIGMLRECVDHGYLQNGRPFISQYFPPEQAALHVRIDKVLARYDAAARTGGMSENCTCHDAVAELLPKVPAEKRGDLLMGATCFPFGDCADVREQLIVLASETDGTFEACCAKAEADLNAAMIHDGEPTGAGEGA